MRSVLLVHPDADAWVQNLDADAEITTVGTAQAARAYLAGTAFDLVLVGPDVPGAEAIGALRDVLGLATPVEPVAGADDLRQRLAARPAAPAKDVREDRSGLAQVRDELGRVAHALNNPLAVIAGNAQLALEMAGALDTDDSIVEALRSIAAAAAELEALFGEVAGLRTLVERAGGESLPG